MPARFNISPDEGAARVAKAIQTLGGFATPIALADELGWGSGSVRRYADAAVDRGLVTKTGRARSLRYRLTATKPKHDATELTASPTLVGAGIPSNVERESAETIVAEGIAQGSVKARLMRLIAELGPFADMGALQTSYIERYPGESRVVWEHLVGAVWSLQKQGLVSMIEGNSVVSNVGFGHHGKGGPKGRPITKITATRQLYDKLGLHEPARPSQRSTQGGRSVTGVRGIASSDAMDHGAVGAPATSVKMGKGGYVQRMGGSHGFKDPTDPRYAPSVTTGGPIERSYVPVNGASEHDVTLVVEPSEVPPPFVVREATRDELEPQTFPLLLELRERQRRRVAQAEHAAKLIEAAAVLETVDPAASAELIARAQGIEGEPFTNIESEYLRFADTLKEGSS